MGRRLLLVGGVVLLALLLVAVTLGLHDMSNLGGSDAGRADSSVSLSDRLLRVADRPTLRLTHRGRKTGRAHSVTIWFVVEGETVYLTTMDRSRQWVRNVLETPRVELQIGPEHVEGTVVPVTAEPEKRREYELLTRKYWIMRLMDRGLRLVGRDPSRNIDLGRGGFFRVEPGA